MTLLLALTVLLLIAFLVGIYVLRNLLPLAILQPEQRRSTATPGDFGLAYEHVPLPVAPGVVLDSFFVPATIAPRANLIILHGVGSCKETYLPFTKALCAMGYNLFLPDQRAHGKSGGKYITFGYREKEDVSKMVDWLSHKTGDLRTGIYGNSMGGAIALQSLGHDPRLAFGLIESTFTKLPAVIRAYARRLSFAGIPDAVLNFIIRRAGEIAEFDPWSIRPIDVVARLQQPVFFIHGDADDRINYAQAQQLFAACSSPDKQLYLVHNGDHEDLWGAGDKEYPQRWYGFLQRMVTLPSS